jgi:argininosuccinate lyase
VQRDRHASYASALALLAASIEKIATEIRHLQRTEVLEAEEYFSVGQKGSSAMPHKRNPIVVGESLRPCTSGTRPIVWPRWRMWRCGMSAISATLRWSG